MCGREKVIGMNVDDGGFAVDFDDVVNGRRCVMMT